MPRRRRWRKMAAQPVRGVPASPPAFTAASATVPGSRISKKPSRLAANRVSSTTMKTRNSRLLENWDAPADRLRPAALRSDRAARQDRNDARIARRGRQEAQPDLPRCPAALPGERQELERQHRQDAGASGFRISPPRKAMPEDAGEARGKACRGRARAAAGWGASGTAGGRRRSSPRGAGAVFGRCDGRRRLTSPARRRPGSV